MLDEVVGALDRHNQPCRLALNTVNPFPSPMPIDGLAR